MKNDDVEKFNTANVVFRGSGSGIFTTNYSKVGQIRSLKLKPEQIDGDITVNVRSGLGKSGESLSLQDQAARNSRYKLQMICD